MYVQIKQFEHKTNKRNKQISYSQFIASCPQSDLSFISKFNLEQLQIYLKSKQKLSFQQIKLINQNLNCKCLELESKINSSVIQNLNKIWNHPEHLIKDLSKLKQYCYDKFLFEYTKKQQIKQRKLYRRIGNRRRHYLVPKIYQTEKISVKYNGQELAVDFSVKFLKRFRLLSSDKDTKDEFLDYIKYLNQRIEQHNQKRLEQ